MAKKKATKSTRSSNRKSDHTLSGSERAAIGVGITAAAAAAAGAYFLYGSKNAKKNRAKVKSWMLKAKAEALETLEKAESMSREEYEEMVDRIAGAYSVLKDATKSDIADFKKEMKAYWENIAKEAGQTATREAKRSAKRIATKTVKNARSSAKKASKKKK